MTYSASFKKTWPQLASGIALSGITIALLNMALAITAYAPTSQPVGYIAQDEVSNYDLTSGSETLFRPEYETEFWSGNLYAYPVDIVGNVNTGGELWSGGARAAIDAQNFDTGRVIATMKSDGSKIPFRWASLSTGTGSQQAALATTVGGAAVTGDKILDFVRGDTSNEDPSGAKLRNRKAVLGDIVHSRPYYISDATSPTIFVGANDGMLHAINAAVSGTGIGSERWAYVPSMLIPKLNTLAANPYTHDYFVDGQINIANVTISSATKRVLVGGLGAGGKGLYALDITTLTAANETDLASKILWEIDGGNNTVNYAAVASTTENYKNLGYTYGTPLLAKVHNGAATPDVVIIGNGYNNNTAGDYQAYLYVINVSNGQIIKSIKAGTSGSSTSPNGIFAVNAVDTDGDGAIETVYGGDLNGTMWKFDLSNTTTSSWSASALLVTSPAQPITTTPSVALHPNGGYMVSFGTGAILKAADMTDSTVHYAYGIWDGAPSPGSKTLLTQTLTERVYGASRVRRVTANAINWNNHKGWQVALPAGEKVLGEGSFTESGRFYFNSFNSTVTHAIPNTTTVLTGENWLMELDYLTGGSKNIPFLDMDGNLLLNDADRIKYITTDSIPTGKAIGDPILTTDGIPVGKWLSSGVQSQPILVQLQTLNTTLFNQNPNVIFPPQTTERGVAGGHFDVDNFLVDACNTTSTSGKASGTIEFTYNNSKNPSNLTITIGGTSVVNGDPGNLNKNNMAQWVVDQLAGSTTYTAARNGAIVTITAINFGTTYNATLSVSSTGANNFNFSKTNLTGGTGSAGGVDSSTSCNYDTHTHQYDDKFDKTGLNMLNASETKYNLSLHIPSTSTQFKVLIMNQYLNPAVSLHIGNNTYDPASGNGYVSLKNYQTSANLDISTVTTYTRSNIGSLAVNMPVNAFTVKDWWGGDTADLRVGLHPTQPQCVWDDSNNNGKADLYQAVIPPANGTNGPGTDSRTEGARHNGALTVQLIKASTPQTAIEENVSGRPEYGWRVKSGYYSNVLAEYIVYWHHPNAMCYGDTGRWDQQNRDNLAWNTTLLMDGSGWKKDVPEDIAVTPSSANRTPAAGSTDPKLGSLGGACGNGTTVTTQPSANVTVITSTCGDTLIYRITKTANDDGTVTIVTELGDGTTTTEVIANAGGNVKTGGDERGLQSRTGRVSWHELIRD
ncbi:MAG: PilC/PilY family type IV pilus protein [Sideroxydans sp.]|nr:PilC/PilY family type IV pilus protein [Sideroxydans sp.]